MHCTVSFFKKKVTLFIYIKKYTQIAKQMITDKRYTKLYNNENHIGR